MNQSRNDRFDDLIADQLCEHQTQLERRRVVSGELPDEQDFPDDLKAELDAAKRCLDLLHQFQVNTGIVPNQIHISTDRFRIPSHIARFAIVEKLGVGGFGVVFRGVDPGTQRHVAIKIPRADLVDSPEMLARFAAEARAAAQLEHPNILAVYESGFDQTLPYIVMPYIPGDTLAEWRQKQPSVAPWTSAWIVLQVALAVTHAHERGILHRDIKPVNVLLAPSTDNELAEFPFVPKLTDFGLAKCADLDLQSTRTGTVIGTICYMSPEQAQGHSRDITARSDVYGLGALLYEMLTGAPPYQGAHPLETIQNIFRDDPLLFESNREKVPVELKAICFKCLEKLPANRYDSAKALAADLQRFLNGEPIQARSISMAAKTAKWCRRHPARASVLASIVVGLTALVSVSLWYNARLSTQLGITNYQRRVAREREIETRRRAYVSDMRNAQMAWDHNDVAHMLRLLDRYEAQEGEPDLRDFAWWYLRRNYDESSRILGSHEGGGTAVALSRSGQLVASGGKDSLIRLWSAVDGRLLGELQGHGPGAVESLDFSPMAERLVSAGEDGTLRIWDVAERRLLFVRQDHGSAVSQAIYSPDGAVIASGGADQTVRLWDSATGEPLAAYTGHTKRVRCLAFHPTIPVLATGSLDGTIRFWNIDTDDADSKVPRGIIQLVPDGDWPRCLAFEPGGNSLAVGTIASELIRFRTTTFGFGEQLSLEKLPQLNARSLAWPSKGGLCIAFSNSEIHVCERDGLDGPREILRGHADTVFSIAASSDATCLVSASSDGQVRYWPNYQDRARICAAPHRGTAWTDYTDAYEIQWCGCFLAIDFKQEQLTLYRMPERIVHRQFAKANDDRFAMSPRGDVLLIFGHDGRVRCMQLEKNEILWDRQLPSHPTGSGSTFCAIDKSSRYVAVICQTDVHVLPLEASAVRNQLKHPKSVRALMIRENPTSGTIQLISTCDDGIVRFWDLAEGQLLQEHRASMTAIGTATLLDDSRQLATGGSEGRMRVWNLLDLTQAAPVASRGSVTQIGELSTDKILLWHGRDISCWNLREESELLVFPNLHPYGGFAVSPDGDQFAIPQQGYVRLIGGRPFER